MESFEGVAVQYEKMIYKIIHSLHIYKEIDEYYQIGLIALWESWYRFVSEKGEFTSYAYKYVRGRILQEMGKKIKDGERNIYPEEEFWLVMEDPSKVRFLESDILLSYCERLTDNQKKWVFYTCMEGLSIREIAEKEAVSLSAVKCWRAGAKEKLKRTLQ